MRFAWKSSTRSSAQSEGARPDLVRVVLSIQEGKSMSLSAMQLTLNQAKRGVDTTGSVEAVRDLLAMVLHEVRTPLSCLTATVEVLADSFEELGPQDARVMLR